jgi:ATP adenylyltransferase
MAVRYLTPAGENALALAIRDNYPVTELHTLVIPKRHATTFFDLFEPEKRAINQLLDGLRVEIMRAGPGILHRAISGVSA